MARSNVEARLATLEADVAQLKRESKSPDKTQKSWLTETFGVYADFPEYDQVIEYGRKYRESLKPSAKGKPARPRQAKKPATQKA